MSDALKLAQELYRDSIDALDDQRRQITEDLAFSDPSKPDQWDQAQRLQRESDPGGKRPCLVLDQTGQYVANVAGQIEKQPPSLHAIPVSGGADKKAAEQIDGRFRHIEYASRANAHYARALTSAARTGVGYLVIRPEYTDRALGYQEPRISCEPDPLRVVFDPWSVDTDGKDATFGFILTPINPKVFEKRWGKKAQKDFGDTDATFSSRDDRKSILVAEYWWQDTQKKNVVVYLDETGQETSEVVEDELWYEQAQASGMPYQYVRSYADKITVVKWQQMSGADILEESEYPADSIGIVPVYGYVGFSDGRMKYCGIPRRARSAQQAYNYHMSELMVPNTMILMPERALSGAGVKSLWDRARVERRGFMPYADRDEEGPINQPSLMPMDGINHEQGAQQALRDIQASIGMYQANLGAPSNESSGVAIESRKQQGEASTAHFPSNMAASLGQVGKIVMEMDARLADTRRKQPIIGVDQSAGSVTVDPDQQQAFARKGNDVTINPKVGTYGVRVVVGASYSTQRTQTNAAFAEIMRGNKELAATVAPFWAQTLDFPGSDKFAQAMASMAPPPVKAILQPEGAEDEIDPATMAQQLAECKAALQEAIQHAQAAQDDADQSIDELASIKRDKEIDQYKAETDRLKVTGANVEQIEAITQQLVGEMLDPAMGQMQQVLGATQEGADMGEQQFAELSQSLAAVSQEQQALMQGVAEQMAQGQQAISQGQEMLAQMLAELASLTKRTRKRIPVRNAQGDITEVIDKMDDEPSEGE
jgi:hypothetical protein